MPDREGKCSAPMRERLQPLVLAAITIKKWLLFGFRWAPSLRLGGGVRPSSLVEPETLDEARVSDLSVFLR